MPLSDVLTDLRADPRFMENVATWRTIPARAAGYAEFPNQLHPLLRQSLAGRGISQLYTHQAEAVEQALRGNNPVVVTPTASGKTLCYNLPVLHSLLSDPDARALYLFPTKALAQDQVAELGQFGGEIKRLRNLETEKLERSENPVSQSLNFSISQPFNLSVSTYDGDTPSAHRAKIRKESRLILSNPDMLHAGILPYHTGWAGFFANLRYVVIDEIHIYRGVFGSHVTNVMRRLQRICAFYGGKPQFVCTSATIANPQELAESLIEQPVTLIDQNGAPSGEKHIILYNPFCYDPERGLRRAATLEARELAARTILGGVQTIVFGRARSTTEVLLTYVRERILRSPAYLERDNDAAQSTIHETVRGYRGGYLPAERREIEAGLRSGDVHAVVATNALELGIDIGQLQAAVLCGYPGSIASTWQQIGRSGRTQEAVLAIMVATSGVLDQYIIQHPEFIFDQSPERAITNANNLMLLVDQLRCAAFELPFAEGEHFGNCTFTSDILALLSEQGDVQEHGKRFFWSGEGYPARQVSLRSAGNETVVIEATLASDGAPHRREVIGEVDRPSALHLLHDGAIYIHQGRSYLVEELDLDGNYAAVRPVEVDFYTDVGTETSIEILGQQLQTVESTATVACGELLVQSQVMNFRRIKRLTHENLGVQPLEYPPELLETEGYWFCVSEETQNALMAAGQWMDAPNDYGPNWQEQRKRVRARDGYKCAVCSTPEAETRQHDVHHTVPFRTFGYLPGYNENYRDANRLDNLQLLCRSCHQRVEAGVRTRGGLDGLAYTLHQLASLYLMCDRSDLGVSVERAEAPHGDQKSGEEHEEKNEALSELPTIYIYERIAAGLGFSQQLFDLHDQLLDGAYALIRACPCQHGCPGCVGPVLENELAMLETKKLTLALLEALRGEGVAVKPAAVDGLADEVDFFGKP